MGPFQFCVWNVLKNISIIIQEKHYRIIIIQAWVPSAAEDQAIYMFLWNTIWSFVVCKCECSSWSQNDVYVPETLQLATLCSCKMLVMDAVKYGNVSIYWRVGCLQYAEVGYAIMVYLLPKRCK